MSIQANINQMTSLAGFLFSQSPLAEKHKVKVREDAANEAKIEAVNKAIEDYNIFADQGREIDVAVENWAEKTKRNVSLEEKKARAEAESKGQLLIGEKGEEAYRAKFEMDPTEENYDAYVRAMTDRPDITRQTKAYISKLDKQIEARDKAADDLAAEQSRIAASNSLDLSKLDERARPRVERAYKKAERDTKYLTKKEDNK